MLQKELISYEHDGVELEGYFVFENRRRGKKPGVLVIHEFMGLGDPVIEHADALAKEGYKVLAADMYGKGVRPASPDEASKTSRIYRKDRLLMAARARAGLDALSRQPDIDENALLAAGFSFGGCAALELARSGADIRGVASFYGYLDTPRKAGPGDVKGEILVLHGARDRVVPLSDAWEFAREMDQAGVDCEIMIYSKAGHGFSNRSAPANPAAGAAFHEKTARRAWRHMLSFFNNVLDETHQKQVTINK